MATSVTGAVKRTACDRCHGQKLRCLRDHTSLARKAGRPFSNKQSQEPRRNQNHNKWETTQQTGDNPASILNFLDIGSPLSSVTFSPSDGLSMIDTSILDDSSMSSKFSSSFSNAEGAEMDFDWGEAYVGPDAEVLWKDTQLEIDQLLQHKVPTGTIEGSFNVSKHLESGLIYDDHVQRLASLSGEIFTQTNVCRDVSQMDSIKTLIADAISSSSTLTQILTSLRDTLFRQETKMTDHCTSSLDTDTQKLDTATTLQILTVYVRLIELHFTLYVRIQTMVSPPELSSTPDKPSTPSSVSTTPPAFPSLTIGGISLAPYSGFQLRFLLQICVHHLGEIETLLGLPAGLRVSDVEEGSREHGGILCERNGVTSTLVRTVMMGAGTSVRGIGDTLEKLKKALEGRIKF